MRHPAPIIACTLLLAACAPSDRSSTAATPAAPAGASTVTQTMAAQRGEAVSKDVAMLAAPTQAGQAMSDPAMSEAAVRQTVTLFGAQLKNVSTLAPPDALRKQLRTSYADLVTPRLLQAWMATPTRAPGRDVSSPWPESIAIAQINCSAADTCDVRGAVRYVTSVEVANGGTADTRAIRLGVARTADGWRIDSVRP